MPPWYQSWFWSPPLILATVILHVFGLGTIRGKGVILLEKMAEYRSFSVGFALLMRVTICILQ